MVTKNGDNRKEKNEPALQQRLHPHLSTLNLESEKTRLSSLHHIITINESRPRGKKTGDGRRLEEEIGGEEESQRRDIVCKGRGRSETGESRDLYLTLYMAVN